MDDVTSRIIEILEKHMREVPPEIGPETKISALKIESLDLAMIVFDIEDTFGVEIPYNANEDVDDFETVGNVADKVKALVDSSSTAARHSCDSDVPV